MASSVLPAALAAAAACFSERAFSKSTALTLMTGNTPGGDVTQIFGSISPIDPKSRMPATANQRNARS